MEGPSFLVSPWAAALSYLDDNTLTCCTDTDDDAYQSDSELTPSYCPYSRIRTPNITRFLRVIHRFLCWSFRPDQTHGQRTVGTRAIDTRAAARIDRRGPISPRTLEQNLSSRISLCNSIAFSSFFPTTHSLHSISQTLCFKAIHDCLFPPLPRLRFSYSCVSLTRHRNGFQHQHHVLPPLFPFLYSTLIRCSTNAPLSHRSSLHIDTTFSHSCTSVSAHRQTGV